MIWAKATFCSERRAQYASSRLTSLRLFGSWLNHWISSCTKIANLGSPRKQWNSTSATWCWCRTMHLQKETRIGCWIYFQVFRGYCCRLTGIRMAPFSALGFSRWFDSLPWRFIIVKRTNWPCFWMSFPARWILLIMQTRLRVWNICQTRASRQRTQSCRRVSAVCAAHSLRRV